MSTTTGKVRPGSNETSTAPARYEDDLYGWVDAQIALLKAGRLTERRASSNLTISGRRKNNMLLELRPIP
ncbi:hypothetical protein [Bradyrhizobium nitroreducens]|uniref:hypothetical protein n=1 Tax=Bradyrhizobium nitroreducens TaxID=709803 RepID=UPI00157F9ECB|nr:hypothetical protein [Bradyrhizobium nitroreducens]